METIRQLVEWVAVGIELLAVAVIVGAILAALWPGPAGTAARE